MRGNGTGARCGGYGGCGGGGRRAGQVAASVGGESGHLAFHDDEVGRKDAGSVGHSAAPPALLDLGAAEREMNEFGFVETCIEMLVICL